MAPQPYEVPFAFQHRYGNFTTLKVLFQMGEGYVVKHRGRGLPIGLGAGAVWCTDKKENQIFLLYEENFFLFISV